MIDGILQRAPVFLLMYVRCLAMLMTLPLFSMRTVSRTAKIALAGYMTFILLPSVDFSAYTPYIAGDGAFTLEFVLLAAGEGLIGVIIGFFVTLIFAAFSTAGQFFAFQMGFSASEVYDSLSQVENPLMGQFLNLVAMLVFMQNRWFQKLFAGVLASSYASLNAVSLVESRSRIVRFLVSGLTGLFADALVISLPIIGTLLMISICTGLLSKAAPQMNLLSEGFPVMILVSFLLVMWLMPSLCDFFIRSFSRGFSELHNLFMTLRGGAGGG